MVNSACLALQAYCSQRCAGTTHGREFEAFSTKPFQLNRKGTAHSIKTWQNTQKHVHLILGHCHHYHHAHYAAFLVLPTDSTVCQLYAQQLATVTCTSGMNFLGCAKHVLMWWQSKLGGQHPSFVQGL